MVQYSADGNTAVYCGYKFRRDPDSGYYLCTKKTDAGKRERLHVFVWRTNKGEIPCGYHIHHKDGDKGNNEPDNLACLPESDHMSHHTQLYVSNHKDEMVKNLLENAMPKAKGWHASEAGRKWHSDHIREVIAGMRPEVYVCKHCGGEYEALPIGAEKKYCSNRCKAAARRASGIDNERRFCRQCGKEFEANKYSGAKFCSGRCAAVFRWSEKHKAGGS